MTLVEIQNAVRAGKHVCWASTDYQVQLHRFADGEEYWSIVCTDNQHTIGLTWRDGVTLNGKEADFFVAEAGIGGGRTA